jgi:Sulfotransferase domain
MAEVTRIAMWSPPRTISTALMRSWENRADTVVVDEPLYAFYLAHTTVSHPGRDEVIASQPAQWRTVIEQLTTAPVGGGADGPVIFYQKHMAHHLLPSVDRAMLKPLRHAFLIRDPRALLASYAKVRAQPELSDLGLRQQVEIFAAFGGPVVDARDILDNPGAALRALCEALGVPFDPAMLSWPPGPRPSDGVWARYWYDSVWRSTGFMPYRPPAGPLPPRLTPLLNRCMPYYAQMRAHRIRP